MSKLGKSIQTHGHSWCSFKWIMSVVLCEKNTFHLLRIFLSVYHTLSWMLLCKQTESPLRLGGLSH